MKFLVHLLPFGVFMMMFWVLWCDERVIFSAVSANFSVLHEHPFGTQRQTCTGFQFLHTLTSQLCRPGSNDQENGWIAPKEMTVIPQRRNFDYEAAP